MTNEEAKKILNSSLVWQKMIDEECEALEVAIKALEQESIGHCKDCKWWKDSDGSYNRGIGAESQCPMNRIEVFEGTGYCFLYEPHESEE